MPVPAPSSSAAPEPFSRDRALARMADETFDVLVIGGGITGAGVALDAASRGLKTALVEQVDFASGTSSKSSKLIHGGLRYLQQHEYRLVYENLAERQRLLEDLEDLERAHLSGEVGPKTYERARRELVDAIARTLDRGGAETP